MDYIGALFEFSLDAFPSPYERTKSEQRANKERTNSVVLLNKNDVVGL
jgi:hypothetical protein